MNGLPLESEQRKAEVERRKEEKPNGRVPAKAVGTEGKRRPGRPMLNPLESDALFVPRDPLPYGSSPSKDLHDHIYPNICERCRATKDLRRVTLVVGSLTKLYANLCSTCVSQTEKEFSTIAAFMRRVHVAWSEVTA